ncbi:hypothetical protein C8R44DRAFT_891425 [Mycena epipterygia]|nr:hypothetical protein C8R44DRAFT_891425 [Mycena epipterygia]
MANFNEGKASKFGAPSCSKLIESRIAILLLFLALALLPLQALLLLGLLRSAFVYILFFLKLLYYFLAQLCQLHGFPSLVLFGVLHSGGLLAVLLWRLPRVDNPRLELDSAISSARFTPSILSWRSRS